MGTVTKIGPGHNENAVVLEFAKRLVALEEEKATFSADIKELKKEAKDADVEPKRVTALAKLMRKGREESKAALEEFEGHLGTLGWLE